MKFRIYKHGTRDGWNVTMNGCGFKNKHLSYFSNYEDAQNYRDMYEKAYEDDGLEGAMEIKKFISKEKIDKKNPYEIFGDTAIIYIDKNDYVFKCYVDREDLDKILSLDTTWFIGSKGYVQTIKVIDGKREYIQLHRFIMNPPSDMVVDHIDIDILNNRKSNLRIITTAQNNQNLSGMRKNNTSGARGVSFRKDTGKWMAYYTKDKKMVHLGYFDNVEDAEKAVIEARKINLPYSER